MRRAAFASALIAACAFVPRARADAAASPTPSPTPSLMGEAQTSFDTAEKELVASGPCTTMCKALDSMIRAADRICELAQNGSPEDQKRCADARSKVQEALARVRAACPECNPPLPYAPAATPSDTAKPATETTAGAMPAPPAKDAAEARTTGRRTTTATIDALSLFLPTWIVQPRVERAYFQGRASLGITFGLGSLSRIGPGGVNRASTTIVGIEGRAYVHGHADGFGVFVGADVAYRSAGLLPGERLVARGFPLGLTLGPTVGVKLVTRAGFAVESRLGIGFVAVDQRPEGSSHERVVPIASVGLGWAF